MHHGTQHGAVGRAGPSNGAHLHPAPHTVLSSLFPCSSLLTLANANQRQPPVLHTPALISREEATLSPCLKEPCTVC